MQVLFGLFTIQPNRKQPGMCQQRPFLSRQITIQFARQIVDHAGQLCLLDDIAKPIMHGIFGQRQRIAIARAMILRPKLVVLDEPTSALDMTVQVQIVELLRELQQKYGLAYLFISHDLKVVRALSHKVMVMKQGDVVEAGDAADIFDAPRTEYTRALMTAAFEGRAVGEAAAT